MNDRPSLRIIQTPLDAYALATGNCVCIHLKIQFKTMYIILSDFTKEVFSKKSDQITGILITYLIHFHIQKRWANKLLKLAITNFSNFTWKNCMHFILHNDERSFLKLHLVFCFQNCSDLLWEKIVLVIKRNFWNSRLKAEILQNFWDL